MYLDTAQETIGRTGETPEKDRAAKTSILHKLGWKPKTLANKEGCDVMKEQTTTGTRNLLVFRRGARTRGRYVKTTEKKDTAAEQKILKAWKGKVVREGTSRQLSGT